MSHAESYVVAKTNSRSMLSYMNQMTLVLEWHDYPSYENISLDEMEDQLINYLYSTKDKKLDYTSPGEYWRKFLNLK